MACMFSLVSGITRAGSGEAVQADQVRVYRLGCMLLPWPPAAMHGPRPAACCHAWPASCGLLPCVAPALRPWPPSYGLLPPLCCCAVPAAVAHPCLLPPPPPHTLRGGRMAGSLWQLTDRLLGR